MGARSGGRSKWGRRGRPRCLPPFPPTCPGAQAAPARGRVGDCRHDILVVVLVHYGISVLVGSDHRPLVPRRPSPTRRRTEGFAPESTPRDAELGTGDFLITPSRPARPPRRCLGPRERTDSDRDGGRRLCRRAIPAVPAPSCAAVTAARGAGTGADPASAGFPTKAPRPKRSGGARSAIEGTRRPWNREPRQGFPPARLTTGSTIQPMLTFPGM